jgi:hypothetical protein
MFVAKYSLLIDYIPYFSAKNNQVSFRNGFPEYDQPFMDFIDLCYETDLIDHHYLINIEEKDIPVENIVVLQEHIPHTNLKELGTILTYFLRQERFCEGSWSIALKEGFFLAILLRLKELIS